MLHIVLFSFFNDTATTEIYTLSLHDALPISDTNFLRRVPGRKRECDAAGRIFQIHEEKVWSRTEDIPHESSPRSEEHTSELQSRENLVCRLLLEKKKKKTKRKKKTEMEARKI